MPFAERAGVRIHYRDEGAGPALVLHTGGAGDGTMWDGAGYTVRLDGFRRLVMDHRGRGRSDRVREVGGHTRAEYAADVVAVADAAGVERFAFAGYSMGAAVGYRVAAAHPGRVVALVAVGGAADPPGEPDDPAPLVAMLETEGVPAVSDAIEAEEGITLPAWLRRNFDETDAGQFALSLRAWAVEDDTTWADLAGIACPTALVAGSEEAPPGSLERMAAAIPGGGLVQRLPGLGHVGAFLDSEAVLRAAAPVLAAGRGEAPR
jgi:3-oxoadipate enol-lactonase / 4-carboxymuconolactone decarboxylase